MVQIPTSEFQQLWNPMPQATLYTYSVFPFFYFLPYLDHDLKFVLICSD